MHPPMPTIIRPGARVLLKPFLHHGRHSYPSSRLVSHPAMIGAVAEALRDCGAHVILGDEGSRSFSPESVEPDREWIHALGKQHDITVISFAKTGARYMRSGVPFPRRYLLARAALESDHIVNCANFQPHNVLGMSGAVKNMFNVVVGAQQSRLVQLFPDPCDLAKIIVDVCEIVRPALSFLDLTSIRIAGEVDDARHVGLLLAGNEPSALDAVAVQAIGTDAMKIPTLRAAEQRFPGRTDLSKIAVVDPDDYMAKLRQSFDPLSAAPSRKRTFYDRVTDALNHTVLMPRPTINSSDCTNCGDCVRICPVSAIASNSLRNPKIIHADCADCHLCIGACPEGAIDTRFIGIAKALRRLTNSSLLAS